MNEEIVKRFFPDDATYHTYHIDGEFQSYHTIYQLKGKDRKFKDGRQYRPHTNPRNSLLYYNEKLKEHLPTKKLKKIIVYVKQMCQKFRKVLLVVPQGKNRAIIKYLKTGKKLKAHDKALPCKSYQNFSVFYYHFY
ncbi:hypothetical protein ES708_27241 [subsurface metagenome]